MLDITKNRSSYQRLPILKQQKCKQTNVSLVPNVTKLNSYATRAAAASNFNVAVAAAATKITGVPTTTTTITKTTILNKTQINTKKLSSSSTNATITTTSGKAFTNSAITTNKVRAGNQIYFLTQEYKDPNFLKKECENAQAQLCINGTPKKTQRSTTLDDKRNNNNSNNNNYSNNNNSRKTSPSLTLLPTIVNGMRQTGQSSYLGNITNSHQQQPATTTTTITAAAKNSTTVHKSEQYKVLPKTAKSLALNTTTAGTPYSTNKLNSRQTTVRPLVHRTIPASAVAAANAVTGITYNNNFNKQCSQHQNNNHLINHNNNNNNMEHAYNRLALNSTNEADDIKYIDSDDIVASGTTSNNALSSVVVARKTCNNSTTTTTTNKSRIRPKSTIICSATNLVFEKMNNYKMAAAASNNSLTGGALPARQTIDTSSIKASIDKFNSFSEQKRLPVNVTLRTHASSGSSSNLQHQHRHSSDFDNCNIRLPAGANHSMTRSPFRTLPSGAVITAIPHTTANSSAVPTSKVITSMHATASAARAAALSNSLPTRPSGASLRSQQQEQQARGSTSSLLVKDAQSMPMYKITMVKQATQAGEETAKPIVTTAGGAVITPIGVPMSGTLDNVVLKKKVVINGAETESDSVRSSSMAIPSAPLTPTSSRYYERSSNRNSTHTPSSSSYISNGEGDSGTNSLGTENREGLVGLRNIGNTCFMNSIIQCLSHTSELTSFLRQHESATNSRAPAKDQQILSEFARLIKEMWSGMHSSATPMELKRAFSSKHRMYSDYNQQDAQEFLRFFLDSLHCALNTGVKGEPLKIDDNLSDNKKADLNWEWCTRHENSLIREFFVGQLKSTLRCTVCGNTSVTFDPFWDLSVSLPSSTRCKLEQCLDMFIREEVLDGDEMPTCAKCKTRRKCTKSFTIQRFPKYLVIHLKRFSETRWSKLSNMVEFPTEERELNMGPYGSNANTNVYYSLYGISNHMGKLASSYDYHTQDDNDIELTDDSSSGSGSTAGGHYVAVCKHPQTRRWHEFNDNM